MAINYRDYLKGTSLNVLKWRQFLDGFQEILYALKTEKAERLVRKRKMETADLEDVRDHIYATGFSLPEFTGYTASEEYLRCRAENIWFEVRTKDSYRCYQSIGKCFFVMVQIFNIQKFGDNFFVPIEGLTGEENTLDQESDLIQYYIGAVPVPNPPIASGLPQITLDMVEGDLPEGQLFLELDQDVIVGITNILSIRYEFIKAESVTELWSYETANAFYTSIEQFHKKTVVIRYTPKLAIDLNNDNTETLKQYPIYSNISTYADQKSILINGDLGNVTKIRLGNGAHTTIDGTITDVVNELNTYDVDLNEIDIKSKTTTIFKAEWIFTEFGKLIDLSGDQILKYTEVALLDVTDTIVAYATFPAVNFYEPMFNSFYFEFNVIVP